jgi:hypothetical protein
VLVCPFSLAGSLQEEESMSPDVAPTFRFTVDRQADLLAWFSGKSREVISSFTIPALMESALLGYWKKGAAVKVRASLNKQNVAAKWAREIEKTLKVDYKHPLYEGLTNMRFGSYGRTPRMLTVEALDKLYARDFTFTKKKNDTQYVNEVIECWARANAEVAELVALLDSRRPKPVIVMKTLSPTVAQNISDHIGLDVSTIQYPPNHGEWIEVERKSNKQSVYVIIIDWPEGICHNKSRFLDSPRHRLCQACGHAIKDPYNWVPILAYGHDAETRPYSLWVGRDCAEKLFGCEVEGDAIYPERQPPQPAPAPAPAVRGTP